MHCISEIIRRLAMEMPEGDVVKVIHEETDVKAPRKEKSFTNKSNRSDYSKNYMREYREDGKDYQKLPEKIKELHKKQKRERQKKSDNVGIGLDYPTYGFNVTNSSPLIIS